MIAAGGGRWPPAGRTSVEAEEAIKAGRKPDLNLAEPEPREKISDRAKLFESGPKPVQPVQANQSQKPVQPGGVGIH